MMHRSRLKSTWLLALALVLGGCEQRGPQDHFDRYLSRLGNTLGGEAGEPAPAIFPALPRPGSLRLELAASKLDTLDFLALSGCAVQVTIGKRNSSLGIMASDSQRLLLELEYLQLAPDCIRYMADKGRSKLAASLESARQLKQQQLPARIFNATLGNDEYRQFWQRPMVAGNYPQQTSSAVASALAAINHAVQRWLAGDFEFDNMAFEILLSEVSSGDGGALLQALALQAGKLSAADTLIANRMAQGPLCAPNRRARAADILPGVVRRFFIGDIQPWSADVERRRQQLMPVYRELEALLAGVLPPDYQQWQQQRDGALRAWADAPRRHVQRLQALQTPCQLE